MTLQEWLDHEGISAIQAAKRWSAWIGRGNDGTSERAAISNWYAWARRDREPGLFYGMLLVVFTGGLVGLWELLDRNPLPGAPELVPLFGASPAEAARQRAEEEDRRLPAASPEGRAETVEALAGAGLVGADEARELIDPA